MKKCLGLFLAVMLMLALCSCNTTMTYTYNVETGDTVAVELVTNDGYAIDSDLPFSISVNEKKVAEGSFLTPDGYDMYMALADKDGIALIEDGTADGNAYRLMYEEVTDMYAYIIKVGRSDTGVMLKCKGSQQQAEEVFSRMKFTLD